MYYLHHCATTTASWLTDYDVDQCVVSTYRTAITAASYATLSAPFGHVYDVTTDVLWCLESAHNYLWTVELFNACCLRANRHQFKDLQRERISSLLRRYACHLPDEPERTPDPYVERKAYADAHCLSAWVRVPVPFWAAPAPRPPRRQHQSSPVVALSEADDLFADLR